MASKCSDMTATDDDAVTVVTSQQYLLTRNLDIAHVILL